MREEKYVYKTNYQEFWKEVYENGELIYSDSGSFKKHSMKERIIFSNNATIVFLNDGSKGVSKCHPDDEYDKTTGIKIAYNRAKIKSLSFCHPFPNLFSKYIEILLDPIFLPITDK